MFHPSWHRFKPWQCLSCGRVFTWRSYCVWRFQLSCLWACSSIVEGITNTLTSAVIRLKNKLKFCRLVVFGIYVILFFTTFRTLHFISCVFSPFCEKENPTPLVAWLLSIPVVAKCIAVYSSLPLLSSLRK